MRCILKDYSASKGQKKDLACCKPLPVRSEMVPPRRKGHPSCPHPPPTMSLPQPISSSGFTQGLDSAKDSSAEYSGCCNMETSNSALGKETAPLTPSEDDFLVFKTRAKRSRVKDSILEQALMIALPAQISHSPELLKAKRSRIRDDAAVQTITSGAAAHIPPPLPIPPLVQIASSPSGPSCSQELVHDSTLASNPPHNHLVEVAGYLHNQMLALSHPPRSLKLELFDASHSQPPQISGHPVSEAVEVPNATCNQLLAQAFDALSAFVPSCIDFTPQEEIPIHGLSMWAKSCMKLPIPQLQKVFQLPMNLAEEVKAQEDSKPPTYVQIRRNEYLVKRPRKIREEDKHQCLCKPATIGPDGRPTGVSCGKDCLCGMLFTSCSKECACQMGGSQQAASCGNRAFQHRPTAKMRVVKTVECGWGVQLLEDKKAGDFIIEYVGEVIDDATCEQRLWDLKAAGETNFYLCEVSREYVIDASFKGNLSRFINHSCSPNLELQKWHMDGEIRVGLFALKDIPRGTELSYDYQFIQFGEARQCFCGAANCRRQLGSRLSRVAAALASQGRPLELPSFPRRARTQPSKHAKMQASDAVSASPGYSSPVTGQKLRHSTCQSCSSSPGGSEAQQQQQQRQQQQQQQPGFSLGSALGKRQREEGEVGETAVGRRVRIWWPLEQKYFRGAVEGYNEVTGQHLVRYDDGDEEVLNLKKEQWHFELKPRPPSGPIGFSREQLHGMRRNWGAYCGCKVRVWSSTLHRFRYGMLEEVPRLFRPRAQVFYDDGERLWIDMSRERWESLSNKGGSFTFDSYALLAR